MNSINLNPQPRGPQSKKEESEFGPGKKGIIICSQCQAVYYEKSWHHNLGTYPGIPEKNLIKSALCPACQMLKDKKFEGQLILEQVPSEKKEEILRAIKNSGNQAYQLDPMDRIIEIKEKNNQIEILTTENQMAIKMAKKLKNAFGGQLQIKWSHQEDIVRANLILGK